MKKIAFAILLFAFALPVHAAGRLWAGTRVIGPTVLEMEAGSAKTATYTYRNAGGRIWRNKGYGYVSIYATRPRIAAKPSAILNESAVAPGRNGTFTLTLRAPETPGTYNYQYQLASENVAWIYGSALRLTINVVPRRIAKDTPVNAPAYIVMDAESGAVLKERAADERRSIASLTKLMTVLTAKRLGVDPEKTIAMERADEVGGGRLRMPYGSVLTVRHLVAAALVGSANNSANAIARATGLSRTDFVERMNRLATDLGMPNSRFADPTGIEVENISTAREVARLAREAFKDSEIADLTSGAAYRVVAKNVAEPHDINNTNLLVKDHAVQVLGGKTGFIYEAGYTLAVKLRKPGERDVIVVVLGCETKNQSFSDAKVLAQQAWLD